MTKLNYLIESGANVTLSVKPSDLRELFQEIVNSTNKEREKPTEEQYLTANETLELLKISKTSLWRYCKEGILNPIKLGRLNRFKKSEIEKFLI